MNWSWWLPKELFLLLLLMFQSYFCFYYLHGMDVKRPYRAREGGGGDTAPACFLGGIFSHPLPPALPLHNVTSPLQPPSFFSPSPLLLPYFFTTDPNCQKSLKMVSRTQNVGFKMNCLRKVVLSDTNNKHPTARGKNLPTKRELRTMSV